MPSQTIGVWFYLLYRCCCRIMLTDVAGSYPYDDLVKAWEYVRDNFDFIDTDNGVAAGASYGGFMMNWIQGNPLGREFKALVTHDGTFVADAKISTEELWFTEHDVRDFISKPCFGSIYLTGHSSTVPSGPTETTTAAGTPLRRSTFCNSALPLWSSTAPRTIVWPNLRV